ATRFCQRSARAFVACTTQSCGAFAPSRAGSVLAQEPRHGGHDAMGYAKHVIIGSALFLAGCAGEIDMSESDMRASELELAGADFALCSSRDRRPLEIDERRSLAVTEAPILARF